MWLGAVSVLGRRYCGISEQPLLMYCGVFAVGLLSAAGWAAWVSPDLASWYVVGAIAFSLVPALMVFYGMSPRRAARLTTA